MLLLQLAAIGYHACFRYFSFAFRQMLSRFPYDVALYFSLYEQACFHDMRASAYASGVSRLATIDVVLPSLLAYRRHAPLQLHLLSSPGFFLCPASMALEMIPPR